LETELRQWQPEQFTPKDNFQIYEASFNKPVIHGAGNKNNTTMLGLFGVLNKAESA
jgi:hypothetical protein